MTCVCGSPTCTDATVTTRNEPASLWIPTLSANEGGALICYFFKGVVPLFGEHTYSDVSVYLKKYGITPQFLTR